MKQYLEGQELVRKGDIEAAIQLFKIAVGRYPDSRHAHYGLAVASSRKHQGSGESKDLRDASAEYIRASEIGMQHGQVRYTTEVALSLAQSKDVKTLDAFFKRVLTLAPDDYRITLDYAHGLHLLADPRAQQWYEKAISLQPPSDSNFDARAYYAEWLLEHSRAPNVLQLLPSNEHAEYLHFLRGVALEQLGNVDEAQKEYRQYAAFSKHFPAPAKFYTMAKQAQSIVTFESATLASGSILMDFAHLIACEAYNETEGGMRVVGWTVRTRVMRGSMGSNGAGGPCIYVDNSGSTLDDKYYHVIYQPYQFATGCTKIAQPTHNHVASDVYLGLAPDIVGVYCPNGSWPVGDKCSGSVHCSYGGTNGASTFGPSAFYHNSCPTWGFYGCSQNVGFTCGNGGDDNCFYRTP